MGLVVRRFGTFGDCRDRERVLQVSGSRTEGSSDFGLCAGAGTSPTPCFTRILGGSSVVMKLASVP